MPQTAGDIDVDNCDDTSSESESDSNSSWDSIVVVDTSDAPSETSFLRPSELNSDSDVQIVHWDSDTNTIPETDSDNGSDIDTNGSRKLLCQIHDNNIQHINNKQLLRISQH